MSLRRGRHRGVHLRHGGFSLLELLVAMAILLLILALVMSITDQTRKAWSNTSARVQGFQAARAAYDTLTTRLSQATLNTYLDYYNSTYQPRTAANAATFTPACYARNSNLQFVVDQAANFFPATPTLHPGQAVFFQAPLGFTTTTASYGLLQRLMNACGYYVEFNSDLSAFPPFLGGSGSVPARYRYRLMEFLQPAENNNIYSVAYAPATTAASSYDQWFTNFLPASASQVNSPTAGAPYHVLAENIIVLVISPELTTSDQSIAPNFTYDSRAGNLTNVAFHQLPPLLRVVMVAIDETSALHLNPPGSTSPPSFLTTLFQGASSLFQSPYNPPYSSANPVPNPQPNNIDADLKTLSQALVNNHVNYQVFDSDIAIRGAKWSTQ